LSAINFQYFMRNSQPSFLLVKRDGPTVRAYFNDCHFSGRQFVCVMWLSEDEWQSSERVQERQSAYHQSA
jgi:hypothetical protein